MKVKIVLTGTDGKQDRTIEIAETGASLGDVLKAAGIETKDKDFTVGGKPATLDTHVGKNAPVGVSARPQGS